MLRQTFVKLIVVLIVMSFAGIAQGPVVIAHGVIRVERCEVGAHGKAEARDR